MGRVLVGTASWTDESLIECGEFYPEEATTPEARLLFYSSQFPMVEVDSSYYVMPSRRNSMLWVERTPDGFVFDVKAFALMTNHPAEISRLPKAIKDSLSLDAIKKNRVYIRDIPPDSVDLIWEMFDSAIRPLHDANKLGAVFLQFPKWFPASEANRDYIVQCRRRLPDYRIAVEFRQSSWLSDENRERTLAFLQENDLAYVIVDEPQGFASSVPPIVTATSTDFAVVRLHGRNTETWEKRGLKPSERFKYLYNDQELGEWAERIAGMQSQVNEMHVIFNNNYANFAVNNAKRMMERLA